MKGSTSCRARPSISDGIRQQRARGGSGNPRRMGLLKYDFRPPCSTSNVHPILERQRVSWSDNRCGTVGYLDQGFALSRSQSRLALSREPGFNHLLFRGSRSAVLHLADRPYLSLLANRRVTPIVFLNMIPEGTRLVRGFYVFKVALMQH